MSILVLAAGVEAWW
ncbi:hypothetical protein E2C01_091383 [Portunus trituberculatus]|uniref:Uncharacterized protein n=1 Tax=Portunus trituberculatus TaxID=210409 RepID=A0A5B7JDT9_PORTR|nr:hypothetical protein [Portunus trituberculatus]